MKKIFLFSLMFFSFALIAQQNPLSGRLTIFCDNSEPFFVYLNGELQNRESKYNLTIQNLNQRYYTLKIVFQNTTLHDITKNYISVIGKDGITFEEAAYKIKIDYKTKKTKLNYYSSTAIISEPYPYEEVTIAPNSSSNQNVTINSGINITINNNKKNETSSKHNTRTNERKCLEITPANFEIAKTRIKKESFDDQKLAIAQNIISNHCLKTDQIGQIAKSFSFAANQLSFVKQAYNSCIDSKNYYLLKDVFSFQIDQQEFMNFINSRK